MSQPMRLRRTQLAVPGSSEKMMAKAAALDCDGVFLDLEDAVAPDAKAIARSLVVDALNSHDWKPKTLSVRINDTQTEHCFQDVIEVIAGAGNKLDTIILPKTNSLDDVRFLHILLDQLEEHLELDKRIGIDCLIEETEGMMNIDEIAGCSDRIESLILGMGDYAASQQMGIQDIGGGSEHYPGDIWHYPRYKLIIACRANGIAPVDGPFADFKDMDTFTAECQRGRVLGMEGKWAIHPSQIETAQAVYSPTQDAVDTARKQIDAYTDALEEGLGAIQVDGVMVDAATIRVAENIIEKAELIGM